MTKILSFTHNQEMQHSIRSHLVETDMSTEYSDRLGATLDTIYGQYPDIIILDLDFPKVDPFFLLTAFKERSSFPQILAVSQNNSTEFIVDVVKEGAFTYLRKPLNKEELLYAIQNAILEANHLRIRQMIRHHEDERLQELASWHDYLHRIGSQKGNGIESNIYSNLQTSLNQSIGFGNLITLVKMAFHNGEKNDDKIKLQIPAKMGDLILNNIASSEKLLKTISDIDSLHRDELKIKMTSMRIIFSLIKKEMHKIKSLPGLRTRKILLSNYRQRFNHILVRINRPMLQKTIRELLINALKFSNKESDIHVLVDACDQNVSLCILNEVAKNDMNIVGIPKEYEKMVFKPFVRLTKIAFDEYGSLDTGLGLPFVEQVILRHNGNIQISNMNDYTAPGHNRRIVVNVSIQIPKTGFSTIS